MGIAGRLLSRTFHKINRRFYWHQFPFAIAFLNLVALRINLRQKNLRDTTSIEPDAPPADAFGYDVRRFRTPDGSYNDPAYPSMGMKGTRFGRNVDLDRTWPERAELMDPNPRIISRRLLARREFVPATTLNLLAAAWLQFQVHDWFSHGKNEKKFTVIPLDPDGDDWPGNGITVTATKQDPVLGPHDGKLPPTYVCDDSHWWDASQVYGDTLERQGMLRAFRDGKLRLTDEGLLPLDARNIDLTGNNNNWWIGLGIVHTLFAREHNRICDVLAAAYPDWTDERLYQTARLVNAALIAKIHTIEWTPTLLDTPLLHRAMRGNWWGVLGERIRKRFGRLTGNDILSGIIGSSVEHHGARYAMTEEFVAVYRMHPLLPDEFAIKDHRSGAVKRTYALADVAAGKTREVIDREGFPDILYHLGTAHPGALKLRNYPNGLRDLIRQDESGVRVDMAALEIFRDRERGVPRYNEFRELLDMPPINTFEELAPGDPALAEEIRKIYDGDIDKVDTLVGCLAETPPPGFAFSDTAFRIFILMASRRLKSDRFFTTDFTPEVYSEEGMDWVMNRTFADVLKEHCPEIAALVPEGRSPFAPWDVTAS
jgi:hypothetical protein